MRRQPKFYTFTCFLLSKPSTPKLPFSKTSNPHFLISNSVFSSQSSVSFISKPVFPVSKLRFSQLRPCFFFISPSCFILPIPCFSYFDPILLFLKLIFLISPPASFISNLNLSYLRLYFPITTVLNQSLRTPAYWSWESESRITT